MSETSKQKWERFDRAMQSCPMGHSVCTHCVQPKPVVEFLDAVDPAIIRRYCADCRAAVSACLRRTGRTKRGRAYRRTRHKLWRRTTFAGWVYRTWHRIRLRCGYHGSIATRRHRQFRTYQSVRLEMSKDEFYKWAYTQHSVWEALKAEGKIPSIDRIDACKGYRMGNLAVIDNRENSRKGGVTSGTLSGVVRRAARDRRAAALLADTHGSPGTVLPVVQKGRGAIPGRPPTA